MGVSLFGARNLCAQVLAGGASQYPLTCRFSATYGGTDSLRPYSLRLKAVEVSVRKAKSTFSTRSDRIVGVQDIGPCARKSDILECSPFVLREGTMNNGVQLKLEATLDSGEEPILYVSADNPHEADRAAEEEVKAFDP